MANKPFHRRIASVARRFGPVGIVQHVLAYSYRWGIRPLMPAAEPVRYAGLPIGHDWKRGDRALPPLWRPESVVDLPEYEATLLGTIRTHVRGGDRVVIVGGGVGITAAVAAESAGPTGSVVCFEGAKESIAVINRTAERNGVADRLTVRHAVVARAIEVYGTEPDSPTVAPAELPGCDVLELDCEGAEIEILQGMTIRPRVLLVETHGVYGAPTARVAEIIGSLGYTAEIGDVAEPRMRAYCEEHDIRIITATRLGA